MFKNFNVHYGTAASKGYASFIIEEFILKKDPSRNNNLVLFDHHWSGVSKRVYKKEKASKKLEMLWTIWKLQEFDKENTFIIDDLEEVKESQVKNCFSVKPFFFMENDSEYDQELMRLKDILNRHLN